MIPPKGFTAEKYPLRHKLAYKFGLSAVTGTQNSTIMTFVKNYTDATNVPSDVVVNPHNANFETDAGAICAPMSIIDKLKMVMTFTLTDDAISTNKLTSLKLMWRPIFFSFPEKLDAADDVTTTTVKAILGLTKDATKEDITPTFSTTNLDVTGPSEKMHPASTSNFTEVFGTLNLSTDLIMEGVAYDNSTFHKALKYYTNKGALKACVGRTRYLNLNQTRPYKSYYIDKFVPRAVRRIVPYSFFGVLVHVPVQAEIDQVYSTLAGTGGLSDVGISCLVTYHEWHPDHHQDMTGDGT